MLAIQKKLTNSFLALLSLPATAMGFALSVQISALSWILSTKYGLDIHDVGLVWAAGPIAGIIGQVLIGLISDNVWFWGGRRRPFILIGGVLASLMLLALPNIDVISAALGIDGILGVAIAIALTLDLAINVSFNPTRSIIADVTDKDNRTRGYTWMQTISGTFGVLAYAVGALFNNYVLIYSGAVLVLIFSIFPTLFITEPKELAADDTQSSKSENTGLMQILWVIKPLWGFLGYSVYAMTARVTEMHAYDTLANWVFGVLSAGLILYTVLKKTSHLDEESQGLESFRKVLAAHSFTWIGVQTMFVYMFAYLKQNLPALSDDQLGQVISISFLVFNATAAVLPALVLEPVVRKIGKVKTHTICIAILALAYSGLIFLGTSPLVIYLLMAVAGIGWAATVSLPFAIMSEKVSQNKMGLYMGLFNLSVVLPQLVASLGVGAAISEASDKNITFVICAVCVAISAGAWLLVKDSGNNTKESGALPSGGGH
jgi:MFS family permease